MLTAFEQYLLRPIDALEVAQSLTGGEILRHFGDDADVETLIACVLDGDPAARTAMDRRLSVLIDRMRVGLVDEARREAA